MASDTWGNVSATRFRNTVNESKMVTPVTEHSFENASDLKTGIGSQASLHFNLHLLAFRSQSSFAPTTFLPFRITPLLAEHVFFMDRE